MKHLPWKVSDVKDESTHSYIEDETGKYFIGTIIQNDNARFICLAVNNIERVEKQRDQLLKAAKGVLKIGREFGHETDLTDSLSNELDELEQAISEASEK